MGKGTAQYNSSLSKEEIVRIAAEAAVHAAMTYMTNFKRKVVKDRHDKRLRNTKLLLKHYNLFKSHCENSVQYMNQVQESAEESAIEILDSLEECDTDIYVESIKRSVTRTFIILSHIDAMLGVYKSYCEASNKPEDMRRYRIVEMLYIDESEPADICEKVGIDQSTYYRDIRMACDMLSGLIFGIDGIYSMRKSC
ncbi:MAG: DUF1492 domain-containing protein [Sporomusaceae bacterium]|nr:DUF1492 domain-containing protein [Sporomusaceae bacterium]